MIGRKFADPSNNPHALHKHFRFNFVQMLTIIRCQTTASKVQGPKSIQLCSARDNGGARCSAPALAQWPHVGGSDRVSTLGPAPLQLPGTCSSKSCPDAARPKLVAQFMQTRYSRTDASLHFNQRMDPADYFLVKMSQLMASQGPQSLGPEAASGKFVFKSSKLEQPFFFFLPLQRYRSVDETGRLN